MHAPRFIKILCLGLCCLIPLNNFAQKRTPKRIKPKPKIAEAAKPVPIDPERDVLPRAMLALTLGVFSAAVAVPSRG